jgi:hypothetical protein
MAGRADVLRGLGATLQGLKARLGNIGMGGPAKQVRVGVVGKGDNIEYMAPVRNLGNAVEASPSTTRQLAEMLVPNSLLAGGLTYMGTGDLGQAALAAGLDFGVGAGGVALAGRFAPGRSGTLTYRNKEGKEISQSHYQPSMPQNIAMGASPVVSTLLLAGMQPPYKPQNQEQVAAQQDAQRQAVNNLQQELTVPGTNFQIQGLPQRALTGEQSYVAPNVLDPYGLSRGMM